MKDLIGMKFNRWTVISSEYTQKGNKREWKCRCECGSVRYVRELGLKSGGSKSCGCYKRDALRARQTKHGGAYTLEYASWYTMITRCTNPESISFPSYGGRGIKVCDRWKDFLVFQSDMGHRPSPQHSLDRVNNDGDYEPGNCRWATRLEQSNNQRSNRLITFRGKTLSVAEMCRTYGKDHLLVRSRLREGWSVDAAMTYPRLFNPKKPNQTGITMVLTKVTKP
jgi:hypothetical protein